jgi:hypothetical protein
VHRRFEGNVAWCLLGSRFARRFWRGSGLCHAGLKRDGA